MCFRVLNGQHLSKMVHVFCTTSALEGEIYPFRQTLQLPSSGWICNDGRFWRPSIGQAVGDELELIVLIGEAEERAAVQWEKSMWLPHPLL
jgi:hypothetical protein